MAQLLDEVDATSWNNALFAEGLSMINLSYN